MDLTQRQVFSPFQGYGSSRIKQLQHKWSQI